MIKPTKKDVFGTCFFGSTIITTPKDLKEKLFNPQFNCNFGYEKTNLEWACENEEGNVFTIYDWKEYRILEDTDTIEFHIGGYSKEITENAEQLLMQKLNS